MSEFEVRNQAGTVLAVLEVATGDRVDAELYSHREIAAAARIVQVPSSEAADARLCAIFQRMGLSESAAKIATEGRGRQGRVRRIRVGRQEATMAGIAPAPKRPVAAHGLTALGLHPRGLLNEGDGEAAEARLKESFTTIMGGDEKLAEQAMKGRN